MGKTKDLFLCLLLNLKNHGDIKSAMLYRNGFATVDLVDGEDEYTVSISKKEKENEKNA